MKIAQIISALEFGGAERQLLWLCQGLKRKGWSVVVASLQPSGEAMRNEFMKHGFPVTEFGLSGSFAPAILFRIKNWLKMESPDIVHTHLFKADFYGGLASHLLRIPTISTKANQDQYLQNRLIQLLARWTGSHCERVIAVSDAVRNFYVDLANFETSWFEKVPIGIPLNAATRNPQPSDVLHLGIVARLVRQKGHSLLFRALAKFKSKLPAFKLSVFGSGPLENDLKAETVSLGLQEHVQFHGFVADPKEIFSDLDVMILPSIWEGAGLVLLESMLFGVPIIASNVGGIPEYVNDGCGILVPAGSIDALGEAILKMAFDTESRRQFSNKCQEHVKLFDFENTLSDHLRVYEKAIPINRH